jgi:DNA-binding IclR family transcriptional regulator
MPPVPADPPRGVDAVERALTLLRAFRHRGEEIPLAELARRTGFYKSTILRLTVSLERLGFLARADSGRYRLGAEIPRLSALCAPPFDLETLIRPELLQLVKATHETAAYYVRDGNERICRFRENSPRIIRHHLDEGARLPLDVGAAGHVLSAYDNPHGTRAQATRLQGWSVSLGERDPDAAAIAVPVFDGGGRLWGALSVSGLRRRFTGAVQRQALVALQAAAASLAPRLPPTGERT